jgi:hypothetical protein
MDGQQQPAFVVRSASYQPGTQSTKHNGFLLAGNHHVNPSILNIEEAVVNRVSSLSGGRMQSTKRSGCSGSESASRDPRLRRVQDAPSDCERSNQPWFWPGLSSHA